MGNHHSSHQVVDMSLVSQSLQAVVLHKSLSSHVLATPTKLRLEHQNKALCVFDHATGELLFRQDGELFSEFTESMLVDAKSSPIVKMERKLLYHGGRCSIQSPSAPHTELRKIEIEKRDFILTMKLWLEDVASDEKVLIEVDSDWRLRKGVVWLSRGAAADKKRKVHEELRDAICNVAYKENGYEVEVAAGVDLTLATLMCIALHESMTDAPVTVGTRC